MLISRRKNVRNLIVFASLFAFVIMFMGCGKWGGDNDVQPNTLPTSLAPIGVTATPGNGAVTITWDALASATSYNIYYSELTGVTKATGTKIAGVTSPFVVTNLLNGTQYYFVVTAVNSSVESVESAEVTATPNSAL